MTGLLLAVLFAVDLGAGVCQQSDGQQGMWNGTTADDAGCVTPTEYQTMFSPPGLLEAGVITSWSTAGDGEAVIVLVSGVSVTVAYDPMDRPLAATPGLDLEPVKTVGSWWRARVR